MTSGRKCLQSEEVDALLEKLCSQTKSDYLRAKNKLLYKNKMNSNDNFSKNETFMVFEQSVRNFESDKSPTKDVFSSPNENCSHVPTSSVESSFEVLKSSSSSNNNNGSDSKVIVQMLPVINCDNMLSGDITLNEDYQKILESRKCIFDSTTKILKSHYNQFTYPVCSPSSQENYSSSFEENDEVSDEQSIRSSLSSDEDSPNSSKIEIENSEIKMSSGSIGDKDMGMNSCNINSKENHFLRNGKKLKDIDCIASQLLEFPDNSIKVLHYILFGNYGAEYSHQEQIQKILQFNGFNFDEESEVYKKKRSCLFKLPYPLLVQVHKLLLKSVPENRSDAVEAVLNFLLELSDADHRKRDFSERLESTHEMEILKNAAMQSQPFVLIEKLDPSFIRKMLKQETYTEDLEKQIVPHTYIKPSFIHKGNGVHLKNIPDVVYQIKYVPRKILYLLHSLLYGRPGNVPFCKENILEFSGYSIDQRGFVARGKMILAKMRLKELKQLCDLFSLRVRSLNRDRKIKVLLDFLKSPRKCQKKSRGAQRNKKTSASDESREPYYGGSFSRKSEEPNKHTEKKSTKLRDFETICSNVECSTPEDLNELNDLLYVKPCDSSEIHQKILDFTPFKFDMHSFEINYRKTLLHYMDFAIIKKMAQILDIEDFEYFNNKQDLIMKILKFLMEMKLPDKKSKSSLDGQNRRSHVRPHILKIHSYRNINVQSSRSHQQENFDSTYGSEEIFEECEMDSSRPIYSSSPKSSFSRPRHRKNGLSVKQEQILFDSTPLLNFLCHPTERELTSQIKDIIDTNYTSISMGDLVKEVLNSYPNMNLYYRIDFIRNKALELLQEMRDQALTLID